MGFYPPVEEPAKPVEKPVDEPADDKVDLDEQEVPEQPEGLEVV